MAFYYGMPSQRIWSTSDISKTVTLEKGQVLHLKWVLNGKAWTAEELDGSSAIEVIKNDFKELTKELPPTAP
jgi:hypothetical protein